MTLVATNNQHQVFFGFHFEASPGAKPVDAAAWVASVDGATGGQVVAEELPVEWLRGTVAVPNVDLQDRVFNRQRPHEGLPEGTGGSIVTRMWGSLSTWGEGTQVTETNLGRLLGHALGGSELGNHSAVDAAGVLSTTQITLVTVTDLAVGQIIGIAAAADPDRIHPVQITAISGSDVTYDRELPFTVLDGDLVYGAENSYPEQAALTNPIDANASTISLYYQFGPTDIWDASGVHLAMDGLTVERGQQPKINFSAHAASTFPTGAGAPTAAAFTSAIEGLTSDTFALGRDTRCFLQTAGVTTDNCTTIHSISITPGVVVLPQEAVTECSVGFPGMAGYRTEPGDTIFEIVVAMSAAEQTRWVDGTELTFTYLQIAPVGFGWCIHAPRCFLMDSPVPTLDGVNKYTMQIQARENTAALTEIGKAKFVLARF